MSNNDDDLDIENFDDAGGFDDYSKKGTIGELWRNNPMVKIGVILAGFAIIVGGIILFGSSETKVAKSTVSTASDVKEAPGTSEISSTMQQAIEEKNVQNVEKALETNQSALPIPVNPSRGSLPIQVEETSQEDPLERWRKMQEERIRQQETLNQAKPQQQNGQVQQPPVDTRTPAVNQLAQSMVSQMQNILENQDKLKVGYKKITDVTFIEETQSKKLAALQREQQVLANSTINRANDEVEEIVLPAGTIEYGQLLLEANTDAPGPVMAQIVSGPLRGGRVIGSFQSTDRYLVLSFNTVVIDGLDYPVQAVAIDPETTLPGVITEIDHRYLERIILPMAAEFVSGLANAISDSGTTSVYITDSSVTQSTEDKDSKEEVASGIGTAGDKLAEFLDEEAAKNYPMMRVASGTPIGILFVSPVLDNHYDR